MISPERLAEIGEEHKAATYCDDPDAKRGSFAVLGKSIVPDLLQHIREQEEALKVKDARIKKLQEYLDAYIEKYDCP